MILTGIAGCGDYQKVLKSTDPELKWTRAQEYFHDDRCMQAMPLLQELIGLFRGTQRMEDVYYMYAEANLCIEDWYMARYTMRNFAKTFPNSGRTEEADYQVKMRNVHRFLDEGNKVKLTLRFRGREMAHRELGAAMLKRVENELAEEITVEQYPRMEGRQMVMMIAPKKH